jgi:hypothetical protein
MEAELISHQGGFMQIGRLYLNPQMLYLAHIEIPALSALYFLRLQSDEAMLRHLRRWVAYSRSQGLHVETGN